MAVRLPVLIALLVAQPLANDDVLEPSVENEVAHALERAVAAKTETRRAATSAETDFARLYATNGLSATDKAIRLVSAQQADGRWLVGTNDVTRVAVAILRNLMGDTPHETSLPQ